MWQVTGVVPGTAFMFRSAMYPAVIQFKTFQPSSPRPLQDGDRQHSGSTTGSRKLDRLLSGDKVRSAQSGAQLDAALTSHCCDCAYVVRRTVARRCRVGS